MDRGGIGFLILSIVFSIIPLLVLAGIVASVVYVVGRRRKGEGPLMRSTTPRDAFVYLLTTFLLYVIVLGSLTVIWGVADYWFPEGFASEGLDSSALRFGLSMLIVAFPIFVYVNRWVARKVRAGEIDAHSKLRLVFTYFTLFLVSITALVDLMVIVNTFLNGDLTPRFLVKAGGVLLMMGLVYLYYRADLSAAAKPERVGPPPGPEVTA